MTRLLPFVVVVAACGGKFAAEKPPAGRTFKDMNHAQRIYFMEHEVMPQMRPVFVAFDPRFEKFECRTCHGDGAHAGTFKMPSPQLPVLPGTEETFMAWVQANPDKGRWAKFMAEQVEPKMAGLLSMKAFDPATKTGDFSCGNCHTMK